jgi:hypothetical protein
LRKTPRVFKNPWGFTDSSVSKDIPISLILVKSFHLPFPHSVTFPFPEFQRYRWNSGKGNKKNFLLNYLEKEALEWQVQSKLDAIPG